MKYTSLFSVFILFLLIAGCMSSQKALRNGYYDVAIAKSIKHLRKNPTKRKQIEVLEVAFKKAQQQDMDKIIFIKKEGNPDQWDKVYALYAKIKNRQERVKAIEPLQIVDKKGSMPHTIKFDYVDIDNELINSKQKAAEYFYAHAISILKQSGKLNARNAYTELEKVKSYYPNYKDIDNQLSKAQNAGITNILFAMKNASNVLLPPSFEEELMKISMQDLNQQWIRYYTTDTRDGQYDYTVFVNIKHIDVFPESRKEIYYSENKKIQDGWEYELDAKGNVKKDSLGNDIKMPKYKIITCRLRETHFTKAAHIAGSLDYINNRTKQLYKTDKVAADSFFEDGVVEVLGGDVSALKPETRKKIGRSPMPFPTNADMLLQAGENLKAMVKNILHENRCIIN